ncbi:MAG: transposase [Candidatus Hydrogenedentes bacterium]|nr:transposase [Candidatus Hydrogenedentota bacterium]
MKRKRKHISGTEKVAALRRHLLEGVPISTLCDELGVAPTVFYRWQKEFFENGASVFEKASKGRREQESEQARRVELLEAKLATKNEVLSELMEEHVKLKKELGEL